MQASPKYLLIGCFFVLVPQLGFANPVDDIVDEYLSDQTRLEKLCKEKFANLPLASCKALIVAGAKSVAGGDVDREALKATLKTDLKSPEFLNSVLNKAYRDEVPLGLEFQNLDSKEGESILGLKYAYEKSFFKMDQEPSKNWNRQVSADFNATGTIASESAKNPRNFLETSLNASVSWTTHIPVQDDAFGVALTDAFFESVNVCQQQGDSSEACKAAQDKPWNLLVSTGDFLNAFQRYHVGVDAGYESNQTFDATQSRLGVFVFGQYEAWGTNSLLGALGLTPSFRLALAKVEPNEETPRAKAGDDTSYYRYSGEVSLWLPIGTYFDRNLVATFNYRHWGEVDPSDVVTAAGLDTYNLRTFSLTTPTGLFVSYSSGKLPFDVKSDDVVALGWKTYF